MTTVQSYGRLEYRAPLVYSLDSGAIVTSHATKLSPHVFNDGVKLLYPEINAQVEPTHPQLAQSIIEEYRGVLRVD